MRAPRPLLVGGERGRSRQEPALARSADELPGGRPVSAIHEDPGRPLGAAMVVLPLVDRAAADRQTGELDVEELEPAMLADHGATLANAGESTAMIEAGRRRLRAALAAGARYGRQLCADV